MLALAICIVFTFVAAQVSAVFANKSSLERLNKAVGICLWIFAIVLILLTYSEKLLNQLTLLFNT